MRGRMDHSPARSPQTGDETPDVASGEKQVSARRQHVARLFEGRPGLEQCSIVSHMQTTSNVPAGW